jgi:hypothetical protein
MWDYAWSGFIGQDRFDVHTTGAETTVKRTNVDGNTETVNDPETLREIIGVLVSGDYEGR